MTRRPAHRSHQTLYAALAIGLALAVLAAVALLNRDRSGRPAARPTPQPGIQAIATDVRIVPQASRPRRLRIVTELGQSLSRLYTTAFVLPSPTPPPASPRTPEDRLKSFFTGSARGSLAHEHDVFRLQRGLEVAHGRIGFSGVVTVDAARPLQALLDVDFLSVATPHGRRSPEIRVRQQGTMSLVRTGRRWLVDGFDLRFATKPIPTPTPGDRA